MHDVCILVGFKIKFKKQKQFHLMYLQIAYEYSY